MYTTHLLIFGSIIAACVIVYAIVYGFVLYHKQQLTNDDVNCTDNRFDDIVDVLDVLDQYDHWVNAITTKDAALQMLASFDHFTLTIFNTHVSCNLTKDEFDRISINQLKTFLRDMVNQVRGDLISSKYRLEDDPQQ